MRGEKTYGCRRLTRPPLLSAEYPPSSCSVRAPPKKFTCRQSIDPRSLFLRAVADAEVHLAVLALGDGDLHGHDLGLLAFLDDRLDVGELERLEAIELALAFLELAEAVAPVRPERELPDDHVVADAGVALDLDLRRSAPACRAPP